MAISRLFGSDARTPEPDRSTAKLSFCKLRRSSVEPLAEMEVKGVLVPVPLAEEASVLFFEEADFFAA